MKHHLADIENFNVLFTFVNSDMTMELNVEDGHAFLTLIDGDEVLEVEGFGVSA